jgi:nicotinate-nucleotide adenylyltransferase
MGRMSDVRRVGYLGGTFDPPHLGHQVIAREALRQLDLDEVKWLITPDPPHKADRVITPIQTRMDMLNLIISKYEDFSLSEIDLKRSPPYYAADTVEIISRTQPDMGLVYIIGSDSLQDLPGWYEPARFVELIDQLAVAPRPGFNSDLTALDMEVPGLKEKTVFLKDISMEISSNQIRRRIKHDSPCDQFLTDEVAAYITQNQLYR